MSKIANIVVSLAELPFFKHFYISPNFFRSCINEKMYVKQRKCLKNEFCQKVGIPFLLLVFFYYINDSQDKILVKD